jgi:hypothetical protein
MAADFAASTNSLQTALPRWKNHVLSLRGKGLSEHSEIAARNIRQLISLKLVHFIDDATSLRSWTQRLQRMAQLDVTLPRLPELLALPQTACPLTFGIAPESPVLFWNPAKYNGPSRNRFPVPPR